MPREARSAGCASAADPAMVFASLGVFAPTQACSFAYFSCAKKRRSPAGASPGKRTVGTRPDTNGNFMADEFESLSLRDYTEKAYLDYSMYVILDRALPHLADGLKP